jgi:hypothetical protein
MEHLKKYIKMSMKLLTEAEEYATKYHEAKMHEDTHLADMYYALAQLHLDGYNKIKVPLATHLNQMKRDDPKTMAQEMYDMIRDVENDLVMSIQDKMRK